MEKLAYGVQVATVGMGAVFVVLALLWGAISILALAVRRFSSRKPEKSG